MLAKLQRGARLVASIVRGVVAPAPSNARELAVGDRAPDFTLPGTDGAPYSLRALRGRAVVIAWFPKALTSG
jgi:peroxiredoxin Q/BCP